jgi:hypothetical protein
MSDLPIPSGDTSYERSVLDWVHAAVLEGEKILQAEPPYAEIDKSIRYVMGDQLDGKVPKDLASVVDNRLKHIILQTVAALTDIHPLFTFKTFNTKFDAQADVLDKLSRAWWVNSFADLSLADVLRYAAVPGTGYCEIHWDASAAGGSGDITLTPRDPRDVIPIRPTYDKSIQGWEGVIIRKSMTINDLQARFPEKKAFITPDRSGSTILDRTWAAARKVSKSLVTPAVDYLTQAPKNAPALVPATDVFEVYLKDRRSYSGSEPITMGNPKTTWCYKVYPQGWRDEQGREVDAEQSLLYPRGRLIICTHKVVLYDGPNPYWHGMFPIAKLSLDPWPWTLLGLGLAHDLIPIQDVINEVINGIIDKVRKVLRPNVVGDKKALPESLWARFDPRLSGQKLKQNMVAGQQLQVLQEPDLPSYVFEFLQLAIAEADNLSGVANLTALTQLRQAPGADSIEKLMEALTPILRLRGRLLEAFLREVGEMVKACFFQFYTMPRRIAILGESGLDLQDFDFDPGSLVPSMQQGDENYDPAFDHTKTTRADRAQKHLKNFTFRITPNSLLAISQISRKLTYLQLFRGGLMDPWTLWETLEIPNAGSPPSGATTITDRLMEANLMGLTGQVSPTGRKATGQAPPTHQVKTDEDGAPRPVIAES